MIIAITQIKSRRFSDLYCFLKWYEAFIKVDKHILIDDNSTYDITKLTKLFPNVKMIFRASTNIPKGSKSQEKVVRYVIEKENITDEDILITPDDDEFWWYDKSKYNSFADCCSHYIQKLNSPTVCVPWTMLSTTPIKQKRGQLENYIETFKTRAELEYVEYKPIITKCKTNSFEDMHYGNKFCKNIFMPDEKYNEKLYRMHITNYSNDLRIYHYRITTIDEYNLKIMSDPNSNKKRTYCSNDLNEFMKKLYNRPISCFNTEDLTMLNTWKEITKSQSLKHSQ